MTLVTLPSPIYYPGTLGTATGHSINNAGAVGTVGYYYALVLQAKEAMTINNVGFRASAPCTGSPTAAISIETVDPATGYPSGTPFSSGSSVTTGTVVQNTDVMATLGGTATIAKGQIFAVKIALASGTTITIGGNANSIPNNTNFPYVVTGAASTTKGALNGVSSLIILGSSTTSFYSVPHLIPYSSIPSGIFNNSTAGAKRGMKITPAMPCRCAGIMFYNSNAVGDYNIGIYDGSGAAVSTVAIAGPITGGGTAGSAAIYLTTPVVMAPGTSYYAAVEPTSATNINLLTLSYPTNYRAAQPSRDTVTYVAFTTASGVWTEDTLKMPLMDLIIDQLDDGAGTGGGGGSSGVIGS